MKARKLLMIPGPIEFEPSVLRAMGSATTSHVVPNFIETFGHSLEMMKEVWQCPTGQPFILSGSGTLAMDSAASNLVEQGDRVLVLSTGYFGDRFADILTRYGADVLVLKAETGGVVHPDLVEDELKKREYKLLLFTHVDTSTAVLVDPVPIGELGLKYGVLTILDGVCSVAGEEIRQEEWGIDVVITASQKAIGVPPGLALMVVSPKAMNVWKARKTQVGSYYSDWSHWLPVMESYENRKPSYFGTPAVNLVAALEVSLQIILNEGLGTRFERHRKTGSAFRYGLRALGLDQVPVNDLVASNTLSAPLYPDGISGTQLLPLISEAGVILAGGLLPGLKDKYFRIGHMGSVNLGDMVTTMSAIESGLRKCGYSFESGAGINAALAETMRL
ncbi:MAG: alanine--glyoxylate aminotransferase family protein [Bacteroidales bacterium]|jgi:alanine-glyoxylate transaminase/serine-glyoxylate transaminase/serine-pyruvate transaminase